MEIKKIKTQICIIGAGPAGVTTALTLAKMGIAHTIVDSADFPRDKVCGDALDLNVIRVLKSVAPDFLNNKISDTAIFAPAGGLRFILPNGKTFDMTENQSGKKTDQKPIFYVAKRVHFDHLYASRLDPKISTISFGTRIDKIEKIDKKWMIFGSTTTGKIEIETDMIVGADGAHSIVLKHVGDVKIDRDNYAGAVRNYWKGITGINPEKLIEFYFPKSLPLSYLWIFPLPNDEYNVGYGMASSYIARKNINVRKAFAELIKTDKFMAPRFTNAVPVEPVKGWGLPLSGSNRKASGDGWLLVGDAASIICPTTGEGIGSGMISAYIAAHFLQKAVSENCFEERMFTNYNREIHARLRTDERVFRIVNIIPAWAYTMFLNTFLSNRFVQNYIVKREIKNWINTAYTKPIVVNVN